MKSIKKFIVLWLIIITSTVSLFSQSIGLNYGVAGVENYGAEHSIQFSVNLPVNDAFFTKMSFYSWSGSDNNLRFSENYPEDRHYFGREAFNFSVYRSLMNREKHNLFAGVGIGFYKKETASVNLSTYTPIWDPGFSFHLLYRYEIFDRFNLISEGSLHFEEINFHFDGITPEGVSWGFFTVGLEYELFR